MAGEPTWVIGRVAMFLALVEANILLLLLGRLIDHLGRFVDGCDGEGPRAKAS